MKKIDTNKSSIFIFLLGLVFCAGCATMHNSSLKLDKDKLQQNEPVEMSGAMKEVMRRFGRGPDRTRYGGCSATGCSQVWIYDRPGYRDFFYRGPGACIDNFYNRPGSKFIYFNNEGRLVGEECKYFDSY